MSIRLNKGDLSLLFMLLLALFTPALNSFASIGSLLVFSSTFSTIDRCSFLSGFFKIGFVALLRERPLIHGKHRILLMINNIDKQENFDIEFVHYKLYYIPSLTESL